MYEVAKEPIYSFLYKKHVVESNLQTTGILENY